MPKYLLKLLSCLLPMPACIALFVLIPAILVPQGASASCQAPDASADVVVAIRNAEPFTSRSPSGLDEGFSVDIWTSIEHELTSNGLMAKSDIILCNSIDDHLRALESGAVDVVISPLTITAERMQGFDFSQQYLQSGLTLAHRSTSAIDFSEATGVILQTISQPGVIRAILVFLAINLVLAVLIRAALRAGGSGEEIDTGLGHWFDSMVEALVRTIGLKGLSDQFRTRWGRLLEILMALLGTVLSATILGVLTTAFVGSIGGLDVTPAERLPEKRIATLEGSTAQAFLIAQYPETEENTTHSLCSVPTAADESDTCLVYQSWSEAVDALDRGEVEAVLGDWVALTYLSRTDQYLDRISVDSKVYRNEPYGWGVSRDRSDLRRGIDKAMIELMRDPKWRKRVEAYLGVGTVAPN
ncbi:ABC transporter substrate-binding protein [uncultured Roseobacter sp.]|uniref:substrate-binding periplasmic protein n=1 Tax=uncultured Roseobacter sp. TaxID=114847 RepID=UPI00260F8D24|nr:transporter substrate-binding domain-containing protein [uncultured Roseobacter sp.]